MLKKALFALFLLKGYMDFNQTCTDIFLGSGKNLSDFGDLDHMFKVTGGQRMLKNTLSTLYLLEGLIDLINSAQVHIIGRCKRNY